MTYPHPAQTGNRRRRFAALAVLIVAGFASLATSPGEPQVTRTVSGETEIDGSTLVHMAFEIRVARPQQESEGSGRVVVGVELAGRGNGEGVYANVLAADPVPGVPAPDSTIVLTDCAESSCSWNLVLEIGARQSLTVPVIVRWSVAANAEYGRADREPTLELSGLPATAPAWLLGGWLLTFLVSGALFALVGSLAIRRRVPPWKLQATSAAVLLAAAIYLAALARDGASNMPWQGSGALLIGVGVLTVRARRERAFLGGFAAPLLLLIAITPLALYAVAGPAAYRPMDLSIVAVALSSLFLPLMAVLNERSQIAARLRSPAAGRAGPIIALSMVIAIEVWSIRLAFDGPGGLVEGAVWLAAPLAALLLTGIWRSLTGRAARLRVVGAVLALLAIVVWIGMGFLYHGLIGPEPAVPWESYAGAVGIGIAGIALVFTGWGPMKPRSPEPFEWPAAPPPAAPRRRVPYKRKWRSASLRTATPVEEEGRTRREDS